jgi:acyl-coenzyme A thioesterase PaaI-like protein
VVAKGMEETPGAACARKGALLKWLSLRRKSIRKTMTENALISEPSHRECIVCGCENDHGMHMQFHREPDGSVTSEFLSDAMYQGYPDVLHGGVVAAVLDGAMTNCLFAHDVVAVTAELTIRYLQPVHTQEMVSVRAWIVKSSPHLHLLAAELSQRGQVRATAKAKFRRVKGTSAAIR